MKIKKGTFPQILITSLLLIACSSPNRLPSLSASSSFTNQEEAGEKSDELDYGIVFPQDSVNEVTITITPENWQDILDDMTEIYGKRGTGTDLVPDGQPGQRPPLGDRPDMQGNNPPQTERQPGGGGPGAGLMGGDDDQNPIWIEAEFSFDDTTWEHIGFRFKGNSSLRTTWSSGSDKFPFKLDFDQFEDQYPDTKNQRFYGFKQLSFSSNHHDESYLREKIAADIFREAGVPVAQTAFYAVSLDYGEGLVYLGLYTVVEVVDDTVIKTQFQYDGGNVYKPEGSGATFAEGSFSEEFFDKETNQEMDDYDDILALYDALHAEIRSIDPETWRQELEVVFDVDTFLNWLAVNTVIQNWDTYGVMNHNYYLYNNPDTGQLMWIPWDNNESLKSGGGIREPLRLDLGGVGNEWPLISFLRDDPVYYQTYQDYVEQFLDAVFIPAALGKRLQEYQDLIAPFIMAEEDGTPVEGKDNSPDSVYSELIQHIDQRYELAGEFILDPGN